MDVITNCMPWGTVLAFASKEGMHNHGQKVGQRAGRDRLGNSKNVGSGKPVNNNPQMEKRKGK